MTTLRPAPMIALAGLALALSGGAWARPDGSSTSPAASSPAAPAQAPAADAPKPESRPAPAAAPKKPTGAKGNAKGKGKDATEPDVLRGPSTDDGTVPGAAGTFGAPDDPLARARARAQAESFNRAIRTLMAPTAPEGVRLTPQQVETVNAAEREFRITEEKFRRDHAEELRALRDVRPTRPGGGAGAQPPKPTPDPTNPGAPARDETPPADTMTAPAAAPGAGAPAQDERAALMERLRKLEDKRPDPAPFQAKVWGALTDAQREALKNEMDRIADEMLERRDAQRRAQPTPGDPGAGGKPGAPATPAAPPKPGTPGNSSGKGNPSAASPPKPPAKPTAPPADAKGKEKGARP